MTKQGEELRQQLEKKIDSIKKSQILGRMTPDTATNQIMRLIDEYVKDFDWVNWTLYHGTSVEKWKEVQKSGVIKAQPPTDYQPKGVWLTPSIERAERYANSVGGSKKYSQKGVVLEIVCRGLTLSFNGTDFVCTGDIKIGSVVNRRRAGIGEKDG